MALNFTNPISKGKAGAACMMAALSMAVTPAQAAEMPVAPNSGSSFAMIDGLSTSTYNGESDVNEWRRCRRWGCRRGWRGRRGVRAGDVIAGVAILGGIAAIASAASNNRRRDREVVVVERDRDRDDYRYERQRERYDRDRDYERDRDRDREIDELRRRLEEQERELEELRRERSGDRRGAEPISQPRDDGQWSDDRYTTARAAADRTYVASYDTVRVRPQGDRPDEPLVPLTTDRMPAYPGGPVPAE